MEQGGVAVNGSRVTDGNAPLPAEEFILSKGKKVRVKIVFKK